MRSLFPFAPLLVALACLAPGAAGQDFPVSISVDAAKPSGDLTPLWRFFGADEPNYATMKDGRKLLSELGALRPGEVYFRAHNLLSTGDGKPAYKWGSTNAYTEDSAGRPVYDWRILDGIFDTYLARGIHPYVEVGFMPEALSIHPQPYQHDWRPGLSYSRIATGWSYPPRDYARWAELVYQWTRHSVERYGRSEVERWWWEIWNEANGASYWHGTPEEFYKLHDYAVDAIRRALPTARVGGPDLAGAGGAFMEGFLRHVTTGTNYATGRIGTPTDFLSFHAKGSPGFVDGHVRLGIAAEIRTLDAGFRLIAAVPQLRSKPIVIGEADPDGCAACQGPQLGYRNTSMYASYTAAVLAREYELSARRGVNLQGSVTWAFEFEDQPYFAGQRTLASAGIDLPILNLFRMLSRMGDERVAAQSSAELALDDILRSGVRQAPDVGVLASRGPHRLSVLVWHYHDDQVAGPDAAVALRLSGLPSTAASARATHYRIDAAHSNAYSKWVSFGSPTAPTEAQYAAMVEAGQLQALAPAGDIPVRNGQAEIDFALPRQAVSLIELDW